MYTYTSNSMEQIARCVRLPPHVVRKHCKRIDAPEEHHTPPRTSTVHTINRPYLGRLA